MGGLVAGEAITALGHMAVTQPPAESEEGLRVETPDPMSFSPRGPWLGLPGVIDLVGSHVLSLRPLPKLGRRFKLPVVKAEQEHL